MRTQTQYALMIFVVLPIVYSIGLFGWCYLAEKAPIFSKRNARSTSSVVYGHTSVLMILIMLAQTTWRYYPSLPSWLTDGTFGTLGGRPHYFQTLCIVTVLAIGAAEKRWIYVDSGIENSELKDGPR